MRIRNKIFFATKNIGVLVIVKYQDIPGLWQLFINLN